MRSEILGWSTNIFLQANQNSPAVNFYTKLGFVKMKSNNVSELPITWAPYINNSIGPMYIKFVTDEINQHDTSDSCKHLHLFSCSTSIYNATMSKFTSANTTNLLKPTNDDKLMFTFPFQQSGKCLDELLQNLIIFGFAGFKFRDGSKVLKKICTDDKTSMHQSIHITKDMYDTLKQDVIGTCTRWLSTDDIDFSMKWFL